MSKTSCIRHPKFEHSISVHSWQYRATGKHLYAALLLSYLEEKVNLLLELKNMGVNYNKGWIKLNMFQLKHGIFTEDFRELESAIEILEGLKFIETNPDSPEFPRESNEIWIKVNALQINNWIDIDSKTDEVKMNLLDFNPFIILMVLSGTAEVEIQEKIIETKAASPLKKFEDNQPLIQKARQLFYFWKWVTDKPRSQPQDKYLRMIIDRLQDGYTEIDIALSFYGMLYRKNTDFAKYDAIHYIVKESAKLDRFTAYALEIGYDEEIAEKEYNQFISMWSVGAKVPARPIEQRQESVKSATGSEIK